MRGMFFAARDFDQDLRRWNVSNVEYYADNNYTDMFEEADAFNRRWFKRGPLFRTLRHDTMSDNA